MTTRGSIRIKESYTRGGERDMSESLRVKSRTSKKEVVEGCLQLDAVALRREGLLQPGVRQCGHWQWYVDGEPKEPIAVVCYEVNTVGDPPWLRLTYALTATGEQVDYRVMLATTRPHYGGLCGPWTRPCRTSISLPSITSSKTLIGPGGSKQS